VSNRYGVWGPPLEQYQAIVKRYGLRVQEAIAELAALERTMVIDGPLHEIKNCFQQNELFKPTGTVFTFCVIDEEGRRECEVYPDKSWLNMMQSPTVHPTVSQQIDNQFLRMVSDQENTDNYGCVPVLWRGLETRMIAQFLTHESLPEGQAMARPEWLYIDPFLLTRLSPMLEGMSKVNPREVSKNPSGPLPDNVAELFKSKK